MQTQDRVKESSNWTYHFVDAIQSFIYVQLKSKKWNIFL